MEYIGVVDHNGWEGESFGFYFENTEENRERLRQLRQNIDEAGVDQLAGATDAEWHFDPIPEEALDHLDQTDRNGYMSRVNHIDKIYPQDDLAEQVERAENEGEAVRPDHPVYKGNGFEYTKWSEYQRKTRTA